ncbi:MAG: S8 family serine peptidase, partial [Gammaproteobacteria bacterium]|nr:S8 family serine peptidase [Gammaproteobacteria bacterium]
MLKTKSVLPTIMGLLLAIQPWTQALALSTDRSHATETPVSTASSPSYTEPRELTGFLDDKSVQYRAKKLAQRIPGRAEDGTLMAPSPLANLPVVDSALAARSQLAKSGKLFRVIVHLDYLPHAAVFETITDQHRAEIDALEADRVAILAASASKRNASALTDAENYTAMFQRDSTELEALDDLAERNEALSALIKNETTAQLRTLIDASQAPVVAQITLLGGTVEFTTIAGNMVIATVPASSVAALGDIPGVLRVVEDSRLESQLTTAPASTMVDPADPVLVGLWDANQTGGAYDPAIIDSGVDQDHPGMADIPSRTNYCSWYLVAASSDPDFNDSYSCDDEQSHGTHVAGIVGSYGTPSYPNHLGMAYGVEKMVNLKAGWLNSSTGGASMYWSDKYNLVDRALYNVSQLNPGTFADDVDGMNLSFGGDTSLDDTDGGRFWDSVISTYSDLPVTIAAGNSGPNNVNFSDPAVSYNAITVANYSDAGTTNRNDDFLNSSSTVGPTADGRRKPDIAAPGTSISAPNAFWETQPDYVNKSGTSMAAPMVLGVIMDLADAGVFDELAVKALLINTAQKNLPGMNIENDSDGWDPALGWGAMNAFAAYFHRFDVFQDAVAPRGTAGDYQLYKGTMRDEGAAGEGRDRATMVWNRVATYETAAPPSTYYSLPDLNLRLYQESNEALIDTDFEGPSNVQQVRIGAGASATDVVINAYAWSMLYAHGGATQPYVLATEEGFTRVDLPSQFQGVAIWPSSVEPNEVFDVTFWLRNDSEIASHNNVFNLELQPGWALISGIDTQDVGSAAGNGGVTSQVVYTLRAPNSEAGAQVITV